MTITTTSKRRTGMGGTSKVIPFPTMTTMHSPDRAAVQSGTAARHLTVQAIQTDDALGQVAEEWRLLFQRSGCRNAFLTFEWMSAWWRHWGTHHRLMVLVVRDRRGEPVALAPLYVKRSRVGPFGPRALCFLGTQWVGSDHLDLLVTPGYEGSATEALAEAIQNQRNEWEYIELADAAEDSPGFAALCRALVVAGMRQRLAHEEPCPHVTLPSTFEAFLSQVGSNLRYNFRRRRRALEREADLVFRSVQGGAELYERFADVVRLHRLRFESQQRNTFFPSASVQRFHVDALRQLERAGLARIYYLESKGKTIAALYGFSAGKTFSFYQCGMDPAWSRLSVGLVMMGCAIEEAIRTGHTEFDFLRGDDAYKFQWTKHIRRGVTICFFDRRLRSQWARPYLWLREGIKQGLRRYLLPLRGLVRALCARSEVQPASSASGGADSPVERQ